MLAWRDPFRVSAQGRPSRWPVGFEQRDVDQQFILYVFVQLVELQLELIAKIYLPSPLVKYGI